MKPGKRSFTEKLQDDKDLPKVEPIASEHEGRWGKGTMLIAAPREVDALMRQVRRGELTTLDEVRRALAARHRATTTCPLTTGIFANLAAHAAEEQATAGKQRVTPYWRTLKAGGELNPKFPGGVEVLRSRLVAEGHVVAARGKRLFVVDHEHKLARLVAK